MAILITICARGGSKGIPGKNIKMIHGKPLIFYSINIAHKFSKEFKQEGKLRVMRDMQANSRKINLTL
jgi:CMP-N-acetylneuraminic acid synthetase